MTLNQYINLFEDFANSHLQLKGNFGQGDLWELVHSFNEADGTQDSNREYPLMWCDVNTESIQGNVKIIEFTFVVCDRVQRDERDERHALNDTAQIAEDFISWLVNGTDIYGDRVLSNTEVIQKTNTLTKFTEGHQDYISGWVFTLQIQSPIQYNACSIPKT